MDPVVDRIRKRSRQAFEGSIAKVYRAEGYLVEQAAGDGYDLVLLREKMSVLVQCKHWLVDQISVRQVRELAAAVDHVGATGGVCVTTGAFTKPAREFAIRAGIELVDGEALSRHFSGAPKQPERKEAA
jgi:restriction endonuclease Mrr